MERLNIINFLLFSITYFIIYSLYGFFLFFSNLIKIDSVFFSIKIKQSTKLSKTLKNSQKLSNTLKHSQTLSLNTHFPTKYVL